MTPSIAENSDDGLQSGEWHTVKQHGWFQSGLWESLSVETVVSGRVLKVDGHKNWRARHFVQFWVQVVRLGRVKMRFCKPASSQISRRSWWSRCLRLKSAAARLLGLRVRITPVARMSVSCECCLLSGRGLCERADLSRGVLPSVCVCVCVCVSVMRCNNNPLHLQWVGRRGHTKIES
jgi:hypothetical protein